MTRGPGDRVGAMLALFRGVVDEIVVALDDRADEATHEALAAVADRMIRYPYAEPVDRPLAWIHSECRGDWVLTVDDDEIPSRGLLDALPSLVAATDVTHYWLPRRWLYPTAGRYLDTRPWRPDYQPRLVLNDRRVLTFLDETHVPVAALGPSRCLAAGLYHADALLSSREARRAKADRYERLHPGKRVAGRPLNEAFYLPELVDPPTAEVPAEDLALVTGVLGGRAPSGARAEVRTAGRDEIDRLWPGRELPESAYRARLALLEEVPPLRAGGAETVDVLVENLGGEPLPWGATFAVATRWSQGGRVVDGAHRPLPAALVPGGREIVPVPLAVPVVAGRWTLTIDLVHEHVRWFGCELAVEVDVAPSRVVAVLDPGEDEALLEVLRGLEPEDEPLVVTERPDELLRRFAGRIAADPAGATRLVVPDVLVREGRRRPVLDAVRAARKLGIPAQSSSGAALTPAAVVRRRLR
ncbi:MAG: hypothetical protein ACM3QU_08830 [Verrucomicrobiota bacterium]